MNPYGLFQRGGDAPEDVQKTHPRSGKDNAHSEPLAQTVEAFDLWGIVVCAWDFGLELSDIIMYICLYNHIFVYIVI
jgi:hypothetical protein